jgi:hypothetical protein
MRDWRPYCVAEWTSNHFLLPLDEHDDGEVSTWAGWRQACRPTGSDNPGGDDPGTRIE